MKADGYVNNKASRCYRHLRKCTGVTTDGSHAKDDYRIASDLEIDSKCTEMKALAKRTRGGTPGDAGCSKRKRMEATNTTEPGRMVTIYALVFIPTGQRVYTGKTTREKDRLREHGCTSSSCRLVRSAFRKYGRDKFALEPIMRCHESDSDANESFWIIQNNTLYPNGYNLRHGSKAGCEDEDYTRALVTSCTRLIPFHGMADEMRACAECWEDVATIVEGIEDASRDVDDVCKQLIQQVHPDKAGESRTYTAAEVTAMLNSIREVV